MKYSFVKGLWKSVVAVFIFTVPVVLMNNPAWADLTIGGVLVLAVNYLKVKNKQ